MQVFFEVDCGNLGITSDQVYIMNMVNIIIIIIIEQFCAGNFLIR